MSGHSKWSTIKRAKEKTDAQKGKIFTKIGREIAVIVKQGGADPNTNARLKDAIAKAKQQNMPNDTIARSIKKASGELAGVNYEEIVYEGYGTSGSAVIVKCLTDNRNRTAGDLRHYFDKFGGGLGMANSVSFMFNNNGIITIEKTDKTDEDDIMMTALDSGADDVVVDEDAFEIICEPAKLSEVKEKMISAGYEIANAETRMVPSSLLTLEQNKLESFMKMIDAMEDLDDVQEIYHNVEIPDIEFEE